MPDICKSSGRCQEPKQLPQLLDPVSDQDKGKDPVFQTFVEANWIHNTKDFGTNLDNVNVKQDGTASFGELKLGVEGQISKQVNLWGNIGQQVRNKGYSDTAAMLNNRA